MKTTILLFASLVLAAGCRSTPRSFDRSLRQDTFDTYCKAIVANYPDLKAQGLSEPQLRQDWENEVISAKSATQFYHALGRMCGTLQDPHLMLIPNLELWQREDGPLGTSDFSVLQVDDRLVLWNRGAELYHVTGGLPHSQNAETTGWVVEDFNGMTPFRSTNIGNVMNVGPKKSALTVTLRHPISGSTKTCTRRRGLPLRVESPHRGAGGLYQHRLDNAMRHTTNSVLGEWLASADPAKRYDGTFLDAWRINDVGLLIWNPRRQLPASGPLLDEFRRDLDEAATIFQGTARTLVDLRSQGGGSSAGFKVVMQGLIPEEIALRDQDTGVFGDVGTSDRWRQAHLPRPHGRTRQRTHRELR